MIKTTNETLFTQLREEFEDITGLYLDLSDEFMNEAYPFIEYLASKPLLPFNMRRRRFLAHVNLKFRINTEGMKKFYSTAAKLGYTFNYHQKSEIQRAFDERSEVMLDSVLSRSVDNDKVRYLIKGLFEPVSPKVTLEVLSAECNDPSKLRRPKGNRNIRQEILDAQFASFIFVSLPPKQMHAYFDRNFDERNYCEIFWDELHARYPELFRRDNTM